MRLGRSEQPLAPAWDLCLGSGGGAWVSSPHALEMLEVPTAESAGLRITSAFLGVQVLSSQPRLVMGQFLCKEVSGQGHQCIEWLGTPSVPLGLKDDRGSERMRRGC